MYRSFSFFNLFSHSEKIAEVILSRHVPRIILIGGNYDLTKNICVGSYIVPPCVVVGGRSFSTAEPLEVVQSGPLATYKARVKSGILIEDKHQLEAVIKLQETFERISGYTPSQPSLFSRWLGGQKSLDFPKGLYIHGAVGGGKTMLMDLFHDTVPTNRKQRVHFNSFMLNIHRRIHALKDSFVHLSGNKNARANNYDPIPPVASSIAKESWLICFDEFQVVYSISFSCLKLKSYCIEGDGHW